MAEGNAQSRYVKLTKDQAPLEDITPGELNQPVQVPQAGQVSFAHAFCLGAMLRRWGKTFLGQMRVFVMLFVLKVGWQLQQQQPYYMALIPRRHFSSARAWYSLGGCVASTPVCFDNPCRRNTILRIRLVTLAWCIAVCTGVPCVKSTGKWRTIYPMVLILVWPSSTLRQCKRWTPARTRTLPHHLQHPIMVSTPTWSCSLCRIRMSPYIYYIYI